MSGVLFVVYIPSEKYELSLRSQDQHAEEPKHHVQSPKQNIPQSQSKKHQIKDNNHTDKKLNRDVNLIREEAKTTNGCDEIPERTPFLKVCLFF